MNTRNSLYSNPVIGSIDQGAIFNNAYSVDYSDCEVYGLIITPRCDISNLKVSTLHYLPIVKYSDWIEVDLFNIIYDIVYKGSINDLKVKFSKYKISEALLDFATLEQIESVIAAFNISSKDGKTIINSCKKFFEIKALSTLTKNEKIYFLKSNEKLVKSVINEIAEFKRRNFYFLESWDKNLSEPVFIVLLREIKSISQQFAREMAKGCFLNEINVLPHDDVRKCKTNEVIFANVESLINPPFMEHLIQAFFHNFGRIGISDYDQTIDSFLFGFL